MNTYNRAKEIQNVRTQLLPIWGGWEGFLFNAFNCMKAYSYSGERYGYYGYDDQGERTYKYGLDRVETTTNQGGIDITEINWEVNQLMLYPNGYININQNGEYTKHYYADALRIASKIGTGFSGNICDSAGVIENAYPGYLSDRILKQNEVMQNELYEVALKNPSATLNFVNPYSDFCSIGSGGQETGLFFYHADHLGSTGMVTDINSQVTQGYLYAPFGEILQEYASIDNRIPKYVFNAKELDEENGMYYYSARYYAPPTFISRDPLFEKYPSISPYTYCGNNPVMFVDPDGRTKIPWINKDKNKSNSIIYKGMGNTYDDGAIHIFSHGHKGGLEAYIGGKTVNINTPEKFDEELSKVSSDWKNRKEGDNIVVVLHACQTGRGKNSFAKKLSKAFKGVTFIAPTERDYISEKGEIGTYKPKYVDDDGQYNKMGKDGHYDKSRSNVLGSWRVFKDDKEINSYKGNWTPKENPTLIDKLIYEE